MEEYITACPRNCYSTCTFRVSVENNKIRRILPYAGNLATPEGPCIKGLSYIERAHSPERITTPLFRTPDGSFKKISREEAIDFIAGKLKHIKTKYGSHSVLWYKGSGMSGLTNDISSQFWKAFGGATTMYGNLCWPAGLEAVRLTLGSVKHNVPWDLVNAGTIVIWGKNPAETNIQEINFIADARSWGSKVIVIDPLRTPTADKADILFSPVPGTDAALALALAKVLIDEDLIDKKFINDHVKGFNEFSKSLNINLEMAQSITGIPAANIRELAYIISKSPVTFLPGYGLQRHLNGGQTIRAILALAIITGNLGKKGAGFNYANLQSYIYDDPKEPVCYFPDKEKDKPFRRTISMARFAADASSAKDPEIKAIWVERGNPLLQLPDSENVRRVFSSLELKIVVEQFMTDTAAMADIILPAKDIFEQSDIIGSYWSPYVQFKPKILDPPGDVMPETEIYYHLSKALDLKISQDLIPEPGNEKIEKWLEKRIEGQSAITLDELRQGPIIPPGYQHIAYEDFKFDTPSGKIELLSETAEKVWGVSKLPEYVSIENDSYPFIFITPNLGNRIHSQFGNLKVIKEAGQNPAALISADDSEKAGISNGSRIRIFNENGSIITTARVSARVPDGIVVLHNGIWMKEGGGGNRLISGRETDMGYGAAFHDNRVQVEKYIGNE
jgi:anaerobic selenocysteine-containing dehydrogenase